MSLEASTLSAHVRFASAETVAEALARLGVVRGAPVPVAPGGQLPYGIFCSPVRQGWVSLWSPLDDTREWFPQLAATLECPGILLQVVESEFWIAEFFLGRDFLGRMEMPGEAVAYDDLWARTAVSLESEGVREPWEDEARFGARMDEIAASHEYRNDLAHLAEERIGREDLEAFIPPHADREQAWALLTAIDRRSRKSGDSEEESPFAEDYMEAFAGYLGIRDAAWDPRTDWDTLMENDLDDEVGLPEAWTEFVVLTVPQLPVL